MRLMMFYIILMCGILFSFYAAGLKPTGLTGGLLDKIMNPQEAFQWSDTQYLLGLIANATGIGVGVVLGIVFKNIELAIKAPVTVLLTTILTDFSSVVAIVTSQVALGYFFYLIFAPFYLLYIFVLVDYWSGRE